MLVLIEEQIRPLLFALAAFSEGRVIQPVRNTFHGGNEVVPMITIEEGRRYLASCLRWRKPLWD
jgi:hypothetical protein